MDVYGTSIVGLLALCLISLGMGSYSGMAKGQAGALSGPVVPPDDANRLYRIDRAHLNSVEALGPFAIPAVLAMLAGVGPTTLAVLVWLHVAIRLVHLAVYLRGGPASQGGNLRTILYVAGSLVALVLMVVTAWTALR